MDYEMADGSQFSLRDVDPEHDGQQPYVSVTAFVDGQAYAGKVEKDSSGVDDVKIAESLEVVPPECIHPPFPHHFLIAPPFDLASHFLKGPSFTYDDCKHGKTFVADALLREAGSLEHLRQNPHPNIVSYYGCVVKDDRITRLCLKRFPCNLREYAGNRDMLSKEDKYKVEDGIEAGIAHLHSLGLAHNDINPQNICIDTDGTPVLVDFDSCLPFGHELYKGMGVEEVTGERPKSDQKSDYRGLDNIVEFLWQDEIHERTRDDGRP